MTTVAEHLRRTIEHRSAARAEHQQAVERAAAAIAEQRAQTLQRIEPDAVHTAPPTERITDGHTP